MRSSELGDDECPEVRDTSENRIVRYQVTALADDGTRRYDRVWYLEVMVGSDVRS